MCDYEIGRSSETDVPLLLVPWIISIECVNCLMLRVLLPETQYFAEDTGQVVFTCAYFGVMCHVFQPGHNDRLSDRSVACVLAW